MMNMYDLIQIYRTHDIYLNIGPEMLDPEKYGDVQECVKVIVNLRLGFNIEDQILRNVDANENHFNAIIRYAHEMKDKVNCSVENEMKRTSTELLYQPTITGWDKRGRVTFKVFVPRLSFTTPNTLHDSYATQLFIEINVLDKIAKNIGVPIDFIDMNSVQRLEEGWSVSCEIANRTSMKFSLLDQLREFSQSMKEDKMMSMCEESEL